MTLDRRTLLKGLGAAAGLSVFAGGVAPTLKAVLTGPPDDPSPQAKGSLAPEAHVDPASGQVRFNPDQYLASSLCVGCTSLCGVRVRVDRSTGRVLRVTGNPWHPLAARPPLPYEADMAESVRQLSGEAGLSRRATACGRGNAVLDKLTDPYRVLTPLKRVGPRGSHHWEPISLERLVEEVSQGGDLFGEGHVDGLATLTTGELLDPGAPEFGPKANQLAFLFGYANGRQHLALRFAAGAFGTLNTVNHQGNCGLSMRAGYAAMLGDFQTYPHLKPDYANVAFYLSIGSAPAQAGNPFMYQAAHMAERRARGDLRLVVVDPVLTNADNRYAGPNVEWVPIKPGTDGALVLGMMRRMFDTGGINARHLAQPNEKAARKAGEAAWTNATHLVVADPDSPDFGRMLRARQVFPDAAEDALLVFDPGLGAFMAHDQAAGPAELFFSGRVNTGNGPVTVKTALSLLADEARSRTLDEYAAACGVAASDLTRLADAFASHGAKAVADCHGGTMHAAGFYTAYAVALLNALAGNLNRKGGAGVGGGKFQDFGPGPLYDLSNFPGKAKPRGVRLSRQGFSYEKTSEFADLKRAGKNPYPAKAPWYPFSNAVQSEYPPSAVNGYPYPLKAMLFWATNPVYGQSGVMGSCQAGLADPKVVPLMICVDAFMTETAALCDYVVPDVALYEGFGSATPWAGPLARVSTVAWPCVDTPVAKTPDGDPVCMETFFIALARRLGLPGFGPGAIQARDGSARDLLRPEDWYLRGAANVAFNQPPVPEATPEDMAACGLDRLQDALARVLPADQARRAAYVYCRGGRFDPEAKGWQGEFLARRWTKPVQVWNETVALARNSMTGKPHFGTGAWREPCFCQGTPIRALYAETDWPFLVVSTKSQLMSAGAVGSPRLHAIRPRGEAAIGEADAARLGLATGDQALIETPGGQVEVRLTVRRGLAPGVLALEHGYGHFAQGAKTLVYGDDTLGQCPLRGAGALANLLGFSDPFRQGASTLADPVVGANARNALPARVKKL